MTPLTEQTTAVDHDHVVGHLRHLGRRWLDTRTALPSSATRGASCAATGSRAGPTRSPARRGSAPTDRPAGRRRARDAAACPSEYPPALRRAASSGRRGRAPRRRGRRRSPKRPRARGGGSVRSAAGGSSGPRAPHHGGHRAVRGSRTANPSTVAEPVVGLHETQQHPQRRALPRTVRAHEPRHPPRHDLEAQGVDRRHRAEPLREAPRDDRRRCRSWRDAARTIHRSCPSRSSLPSVFRAPPTLGTGRPVRRPPAERFSVLLLEEEASSSGGAGSDEARLVGEHDGLRRSRRPSLRSTWPTWVFTVVSATKSRRGDLGVRRSLGHEDEDLALALRQLVEALRARVTGSGRLANSAISRLVTDGREERLAATPRSARRPRAPRADGP